MSLPRLLLIALFTVAAAPAFADETFSDHYDRAVALAQNDQHAQALTELQAAYTIRQLPKLLYEMARAHQRLGNGKEALDHYRRYLVADTQPDPDAKADAELQITSLRRYFPDPVAPPADLRYRLDEPNMQYARVRYEMRHNKGMVAGGISLLVTGYVAAFIGGTTFAVVGSGSSSSNDTHGNLSAAGGVLVIPVLGPFISALTYRESFWSLPWALVDGGIQVAGLAMIIAGARMKKKVAVLANNDINFAPYANPGGGGLVVNGRF